MDRWMEGRWDGEMEAEKVRQLDRWGKVMGTESVKEVGCTGLGDRLGVGSCSPGL